MKGYKKNHNEYCVLCGVPQTNHLMVNHLFYSNLEYKDVTDDRSFCKICGQKKETQCEKNRQYNYSLSYLLIK
jgi:hypothetical protein